MIPEFRLHLLRERDANINDEVNYIVTDNDPSFSQGTLSVRPREENLFKIGIGLNFWSWYTKNARLELDYDLTTGDTYHEHFEDDEQYIGYKFNEERSFNKIIFQEGRHSEDGGWFANNSLRSIMQKINLKNHFLISSSEFFSKIGFIVNIKFVLIRSN